MVIKEGAPPSLPTPTEDLAQVLRAIGSSRRLDILRLLQSRPADAKEIAAATGASRAELRNHLRALTSCGLVDSFPWLGGRRYRLNGHVAARVNASLVYLLSNGGTLAPAFPGMAHPVGGGDVLALTVPLPPDGCSECQNSSFVRRVLVDLDRVLAEAREHQSRSQQLSSQILGAHEAERKRIARELHDDTGQALTSILVRLRLLERTAKDGELQRNVAELRDLVAGALDAVRRMAVDLRPAALDDLGLEPALRSYTEKFSRNWPIAVSFSAEGLRRRLPAAVELVLYRVVQEALSNVAKHSGASRASVSLVRKNNVVTARIQDNGHGFSEQKVVEGGGGLGLFGMRERLALVGGSLVIDTVAGSGTLITARVPLFRESEGHG
jgi:signal transduction histidine kinase